MRAGWISLLETFMRCALAFYISPNYGWHERVNHINGLNHSFLFVRLPMHTGGLAPRSKIGFASHTLAHMHAINVHPNNNPQSNRVHPFRAFNLLSLSFSFSYETIWVMAQYEQLIKVGAGYECNISILSRTVFSCTWWFQQWLWVLQHLVLFLFYASLLQVIFFIK